VIVGIDTSTAMVTAVNVTHRYGGVLALNDISLSIERGSFTTILGANGAGKSTFAQILVGALKPTQGRVLLQASASQVRLVPEGRRLFGQLSVLENLLLGAYGAGCSMARSRARLDGVLEKMPQSIRDHRDKLAGSLSGGERQMLALGRALMAEPTLLLVDEPSMGLAPIMVDRVYTTLDELNRSGVTVIVVEQLANYALKYAETMFILDRGRVSYIGGTKGPAATSALQRGYLGRG
jgi:branched-chain amino acid transport system ATP-binding protein